MTLGLFALGFLAAVAILVNLARIETAQRRAGPPVIAVWSRRLFLSDGGAFGEALPYARTLTGHGGDMGRDAARLLGRADLIDADFDAVSGVLTFHFQASATRWQVRYTRLATQRPLGGAWAPLRDLPTLSPTSKPLRAP